MVDGAQAAPHLAVDVQEIGCDFYAFSGHKVCGPSGIGALYGRAALLEAMPPWQGGGDMIASVTFEKSTWNEVPFKFEAGGAERIAGTIALAAASSGSRRAASPRWRPAHEAALLEYGTQVLCAIPGLRLVGTTAARKASVLSFVLDGVHPHDVGLILDYEGIAVRTGQLRAARDGPLRHPRHDPRLLACFNTREEIDALYPQDPPRPEMFAVTAAEPRARR
ncbi:MAG: aminotransferase class V-fold PLP-dependent enzyme [Vicinamibacteria bacterium]